MEGQIINSQKGMDSAVQTEMLIIEVVNVQRCRSRQCHIQEHMFIHTHKHFLHREW